jgi:tetratricopeptide (TPR) repeat protein
MSESDEEEGCEQRPLLVQFYERYLAEQQIANYVQRVTSRYTVGGLERLVESGDRAARRGAVLALGRLADYRSNPSLGRALTDRDRGVRTLAENGIQRLWMRVGTSVEQRYLAAISEHLEKHDFDRAIKVASNLVEQSPWIAQGWYYLGKAYFQTEQPDATVRNCHQALEINPYHFQAASVMGQAYLQLENPVMALDSFRRALRLNPNMEEIRVQVIHLQRTLKGET